jgi:hypothetical protein
MSQVFCASCGAFVKNITAPTGTPEIIHGQCPKCEREIFRSNPDATAARERFDSKQHSDQAKMDANAPTWYVVPPYARGSQPAPAPAAVVPPYARKA